MEWLLKKQFARCSLYLGLLLATGCSSSSLFTRMSPQGDEKQRNYRTFRQILERQL
ncbi:MAG: hypothetical protein U1D30_13205 [Planctomycetota bacterium]